MSAALVQSMLRRGLIALQPLPTELFSDARFVPPRHRQPKPSPLIAQPPKRVTWAWLGQQLGVSRHAAWRIHSGQRPHSPHKAAMAALVERYGVPRKRL